ncbi:linear amide C-N hydrolase [Oxalobacter paraformigenes]|uniref:Choloylglycine hydrolase/NAAA C-terminal domain-containing protein n=1 Tax=Oxalobacter paraformigenes TaxID=556268 RepID=C3X4U8_9BURK|nr:linear amide C-N hydrolase [Oxalobacter paraformigenes]EEO28234.2 hypothetical protein OFAG_01387 [Oxalobacter paraformigenes]
MKQGKRMLCVSAWVAAMAAFVLPTNDALACTRVLYVGDQNMVATGRNMDWNEDMMSNLWIFPRGMRRNGLAGPNSLDWESRYGSVIVSGYEAGSTDGMNEKGFVANLLFLAESDYGKPQKGEEVLSLSLWLQYFLDNYASVDEAVRAQRQNPLRLVPSKPIPGGKESKVHLSISDASGDSAIFEYINGELVIYHSRDYKVMTNSPVYSEQLAINAYWEDVGGTAFLPGTNRSADRFARAAFFLNAVPRKLAPNYIRGVPGQKYDYQAVAEVMSINRAVSIPLGITTPGKPNIASTIWRTVSDQKNRVYYFDSATRPNTFWVAFDKLDFSKNTPVKKLTVQNGEVYSGEVSGYFKASKPLEFMKAQ